MNAIMRHSLKYPSNVNKLHFEYENLRGSSNLHKNLQLHVTWKLTALNLQEKIFQKSWNLASVFHLNCIKIFCILFLKQDYTSGLKTNAAKFLSDHPLARLIGSN